MPNELDHCRIDVFGEQQRIETDHFLLRPLPFVHL